MKKLLLGLTLLTSMSSFAESKSLINETLIDSVTILNRIDIIPGTSSTRIDLNNTTAFASYEQCSLHHDKSSSPRHLSADRELVVKSNDAYTRSFSFNGSSSVARVFIDDLPGVISITCSVLNQFDDEITIQDFSNMLQGAVQINLPESTDIAE